MWTIAIKNLRANLSRFVATLIAITAGVGFLTAGTMITNSIENSLGGEIDRQYAAVSTAVQLVNSQSDQEFQVGGIPVAELARIEAVPGVRAAVGEISGLVKIVGVESDDAFGSGFSVQIWHPDDDLNVLDITDGRAPDGEGEITIDRGTAADNRLSVGDTVELGTASGAIDATVVGLTGFGTTDSADRNGTITATEPWVFGLVTNDEPEYSRILVAGEPGRSEGELTGEIAERLSDGLIAKTGSEFRTDAKGDLSEVFSVLRPALQGFSGLALFVCAFVIFNTFSVVVGQRVRELALMRAVAATPRQIRRSLRVEGLGIGLLGSILGLGLGALLTFVLSKVLVALDLDLPAAQIVMTPAIVITGLVVGTLITFISVLIPAFRAGRTAPVEAMREAALEPSKVGRVRFGFAIALLLGGAALMFTKNAWLIGPGALLFVVGVFLAGPALAFWFARSTRSLLARIGVAGRLSSDNIARNPKRTSTTTNALVIGLMLVTLVTVAGNSLKNTAVEQINKYSSSDFIIASIGGIEPSVLDQIEAVDGVEVMARMRQVQLADNQSLTYADPAALEAVGVKLRAGTLDELGDGVAVGEQTEDGRLNRIGETILYTDLAGREIPLEVTALLDSFLDSAFLGGIVSEETLERYAPGQPETGALLKVDERRQAAVGKDLTEITATYGNVFVIEGSLFGDIIESIFNFLINLVNGLLGMSIVIALIGIVNTLTLSIFERRRELGLLRAVGMTAQSVRRMIRLEAVQMALLGTVVGMLTGVALGWFLLRASDLGDMTLQWGRLAILFGIGVLLGVIAAIAPTRRVTKLNVLEAITVT